jgi:hypothetical protein
MTPGLIDSGEEGARAREKVIGNESCRKRRKEGRKRERKGRRAGRSSPLGNADTKQHSPNPS